MAGYPNRSLGRFERMDALQIGLSGSVVTKLVNGAVVVDPASIAAATTGETDVTITGAEVGDVVLMEPPSTLNAGIVAQSVCRVSAADTIKLRLGNLTAGAIDVLSATWRYTLIKL